MPGRTAGGNYIANHIRVIMLPYALVAEEWQRNRKFFCYLASRKFQFDRPVAVVIHGEIIESEAIGTGQSRCAVLAIDSRCAIGAVEAWRPWRPWRPWRDLACLHGR